MYTPVHVYVYMSQNPVVVGLDLVWGCSGAFVHCLHHTVHVHAEVEYPCLLGERRHLPCINFKDSARPAELPRWLSWYSICLERRRSWVQVPPEAALLFLGKKELSSGVVACICLVSLTDYSCISMLCTCITINIYFVALP